MTLKLKALLEGYAWERKADGSLPTLADTTAAYARKMGEQYDYGMNRRPKFGKGSPHNDEPGFGGGMRDGGNIVNTEEWDAVVDEYNSKPGYKIASLTTPDLYSAKITSVKTGDYFEASFKNGDWMYQAKVNGKLMRVDNIEDLIDKFHETNAMQTEGAFDTTADVYGDPGEKQYSYDDPDGIDFDDENFSDPFLDDPDFMDETVKKSMTESLSLNQRILNNLYGSEYILKEAFKRK